MTLKGSIKHILLFIYNKYRLRGKVRFVFSTYISHGSSFEGMNCLGSNSSFHGKMGYGSYLGNNCNIGAYIGRYVSMGSNIKQIVETHPYKAPYVSTSPLFYSLKKQVGETFAKEQKFEEYRFLDDKIGIAFKIGNDCWVGNDVTFIGGVSVGDGAVILTKALVSKDVPPYAIVGGIPAKIIGYRYEEETIRQLLEIKWWNNSEEWLKQNVNMICDIEELMRYYNSKSR